MDLPDRIRKCRLDADLTQSQLAAKLGVHRTALTLIEQGKQGVPSDLLAEISKLFHVSADWLLTGRNPTRSRSTSAA